MSQTKFDKIVRSALWNIYDNSCFYCGKPLDWDDLHIDHIIPESFNYKMKNIKLEYGLDDDFDVNVIYNLVPVHSHCNLRKSDELFEKKTLLYYFSLTKKKQKKIDAEISKLENRKNKGNILSKLEIALTNGLLKSSEIETLVTNFKNDNWNKVKFKIPYGVEFVDEIYDIFYLNKDCSELCDKKLNLSNGYYDSIQLINDLGEIVKVSTLNEWKNAVNRGFYPYTNADIKMSSNFTFLEELLNALHKAKMPKVSFISEPWLSIDNLDKLSPKILYSIEHDELNRYASNGLSISDLIKNGIVKEIKRDIYQISLEYDGIETSLMEQFRADFNDDGVEDIFIKGWVRAVDGTMGFGFSTILTRYSERHLIEIAY